jgi:iron complex transport system substrate-binding protein
MTISRRGLLAGLGALGAASTLAACGRDAAPAAAPGSASADAAFPARVTHAFGTTTVPSAPQRIVSVGVTEQDPLLALGAVPIAVTEWYGEQPYATWPWATSRLGDAKPEVLSTADGFQLERIAALAPDLIVGTNAGITKQTYAQLSAIAPTVAHAADVGSEWFQPWDTQTTLIGTALGRPQPTADLVASVQARFSDAAAANPGFTGKKAIFLQGAFYEGAAIASPAGLGTDFLTDLGFVVPTEIEPYVKGGAQAYIPLEKLDVLDVADVLIWGTDDPAGREKVVASSVYRGSGPCGKGGPWRPVPSSPARSTSRACSPCPTSSTSSSPGWVPPSPDRDGSHVLTTRDRSHNRPRE